MNGDNNPTKYWIQRAQELLELGAIAIDLLKNPQQIHTFLKYIHRSWRIQFREFVSTI